MSTDIRDDMEHLATLATEEGRVDLYRAHGVFFLDDHNEGFYGVTTVNVAEDQITISVATRSGMHERTYRGFVPVHWETDERFEGVQRSVLSDDAQPREPLRGAIVVTNEFHASGDRSPMGINSDGVLVPAGGDVPVSIFLSSEHGEEASGFDPRITAIPVTIQVDWD